MKQKYFVTFLLSFGFILTFGQNNAVNLSGNNNFYLAGGALMLGDGSNVFDINNFTIEYDFYLNSASNYNGRFFSGNTFNFIAKPLDFYVDNSGSSFLKLGDGSTSETIPNTPSFNIGQWYHVAFVVNNTATKNIKMFVNGNLVVDYNFSLTLSDNSTNITVGSRTNNSGDCKFDNLRIWSILRTSTEILNNYNGCLNNTETGLSANINFDRSNNGTFRNRVESSPRKNGLLEGLCSFSSGTGCTIPEIAPAVTVTGSYAGIYYAIGTLNGKTHYKTDEIVCNAANFPAAVSCDGTQNAYEIFWDNTQWVLAPADCTWIFTDCGNTVDFTGLIGTNSSNTNFAPCTGWSFTDTNVNSTFSSTDCATLSINNLEFEKKILAYPNPVNHFLIIETKENITVQLLDVFGKTILDQKMDTPATSFDLSKNAKGVYILKMTDKNGNASFQRIIKE
ncbi:LamG-like jellyroll fold domain-containing protein [Flavobacterium sp. NRK F7]|uniref:LamG-like jellyroll fold domain-containing protein n=1 Tax=Flavobacterium sp. NRK F7 TaxID=2954930 RepID=UPI002091274B|nr:LamG-like jellyroll fold domain-containing protein [Flavobacterium sp. NRK F7]MCO6162056.1 T9SS type A sorting domain-containing protein [Flavobacterium sp. NRK F7]